VSPIRALLFERPLLLVPLLVVVQFVLIVIWSRRRTPRARRAVLAGFFVAPLLVVLQSAVVTDRERLTRACVALADACRRGDVPGFGRYVSPSFAAAAGPGQDPFTRSSLLEWLEHTLIAYRVEEPRLRAFEITCEGPHAVVRFEASCRVVTDRDIAPGILSRWELHFELRDGQWLVTDIRPLPSRWFPFRRLADLPR